MTAGSSAGGHAFAANQGTDSDHGGDLGQAPALRLSKTASGSRAQKSTTSYSLNAHRGGPIASRDNNDHLEEMSLPQMAINRQQNMSGTSKRNGEPKMHT